MRESARSGRGSNSVKPQVNSVKRNRSGHVVPPSASMSITPEPENRQKMPVHAPKQPNMLSAAVLPYKHHYLGNFHSDPS